MHEVDFWGHVKELRRRVFFSVIFFICIFCVTYFFAREIYNFLLIPLKEIVVDFKKINTDFGLIYTDITEVFFVYLKVSFLAALLLSIPFWLWQIYSFIAPGLYDNEKRIILPYMLATPILFCLGAMIAYYYIFPLAWKFFINVGYETEPGDLTIEFMPSVSEYLDLVVQLMLAFGMAFQIPVFILILVHFGVIDVQFLIQKRKVAIIGIFILAAFLTPPDIVSQIGLAIPMIILYELTVITCLYLRRMKKSKNFGNIQNIQKSDNEQVEYKTQKKCSYKNDTDGTEEKD